MKLLALSLVMLPLQALMAAMLVISDVDDTIKITDVLNKKNMVYNALFSKAAFSGMSKLYKEIDESDAQIYYISGSPALIEEKVHNFLQHNNFPQSDHLLLREGITVPTFDFKVSSITKIIGKMDPDQVILIGDDTEHDPEIYQEIARRYPTLVKAIYIRSVQNRVLSTSEIMKSFFSAVEIAGHEVLDNRLGANAIYNTAASFLENTDGSRMYIKNRFCPKEGRVELLEIKQKISNQRDIEALELTDLKIKKACKK